MGSIDYEGDTYYGEIFISPVRYVFSRKVKDFFDKTMDKKFSKNIVHVQVKYK